jgi:PAS domain S-box-containing protein
LEAYVPVFRFLKQKILNMIKRYIQILFVGAAFALMIFASYRFVSDIERKHLQRDVKDAILFTEANIKADLLEPETMLAGFAETIRGMILRGDSYETIEGYIQYINNYMLNNEGDRLVGIIGFYGFFDVFGGKFVDGDKDWIPPEDYVPQNRPWYKAAVEANGEIGITKPYVDIGTREISITFTRRIFSENYSPLGVICLDIKFDRVRQHAINTQFYETGFGFLLDEDMEVIVHPEPSILGMPLHDVKSGISVFEEEIRQKGFISERVTTDYRGIESIVFFERFKNGWYMGIVVPKDKYFQSTRNMAIALTALGTLLATVLIAILIAIFNEINEKNEKSQAMAHWYNSILNAIPLPITVTDANTNWTFINEAVEKFLGIKLEDAIGKPCSNWGANICNTKDCGIACAKRGLKQTYFMEGDSSYQVDIAILKDLNEKIMGYIEIVQDITDLKQMAKKQADAQAANFAKTAFLAKVSHEVRTPMNAILGITEIQLQDDTLSPDIREALGKIYNSGYHLLGLINDILDLSKIEAGKMELTPVNYDVPSLINETVYLNIMRFDNKPIVFDLNVNENIPLTLFGDELRIKQILNNLLSNAFKYTDSGKVSLSITVGNVPRNETDKIMIEFRVSDTGQGMTAEQVDMLFDEYTRFNTEANRAVEGAGLGMNITKQLIDLMNGNIFVESELSKGTEFTVMLPQGIVDAGVLGKAMADNLKQLRLGKMSQMKKAPQIAREHMPYGKVLIVDDVETNLYVAKGLMSPYGLSIDTVNSGFETIEKIRSGESYDIVFMDHFMPKMDGIEAAKIMRGMGYTQPIIALTANALTGQAQIFADNGFDGFISKPIDIHQLNAVLNKMVRDKHQGNMPELKRQTEDGRNDYSTGRSMQPPVNPQLREAFIRDAGKAAVILETMHSNNYRRADDMQIYIINVHAMKSALTNIGETELSGAASRLEEAGRIRNIAVITEETPAFLAALHKVIEKLKPEENEDDTEGGINGDDRYYLQEKLAVIQKACAEYDNKSAKDNLAKLREKIWPHKVMELLDAVTIHLLHGEFTKASNITNNYINEQLKNNI